MATKDWKDEGLSAKAMRFVSQKDFSNFVEVKKVTRGWWVELYVDNTRVVDKMFKSKAEAMKLAKKLMESH